VAHYADTSFLVSLYAQDVFSSRAHTWLAKNPVALSLTEFGRTELRNALARLAFTGAIMAPQHAAAWQMVETDLSQGRLLAVAVSWPAVFAQAELLVANHTAQLGARTLDVLHVASAQSLGAVDFVSFDSRQAALARAAGLTWHLP
jgi:predicted nucleic acid-binding protein